MKVVYVLLILLIASASMAGTYGGGSGSEADPFLISQPEHLNQIGLNPDDLSRHFRMTADLDMSDYSGTSFNLIGRESPTASRFTGTFDGDGHVISNLTYETDQAVNNVGVFGFVYFGTICNLELENVKISSAGSTVGGLVGYGYAMTIENCCSTQATVIGNGNVGGLVGTMESGSVTGSWVRGNVSGSSRVGGLVGYCVGTISQCHSSGTVSGAQSSQSVGGLIGIVADGSFSTLVSNCYSDCQVTSGSSSNYTGGLIGNMRKGQVAGCYSAGPVEGGYSVGGLIGNCVVSTTLTDVIVDCYSISDVDIASNCNRAGGLVGYSESAQITRCYSTGQVGSSNMDCKQLGGLVGVQLAGKLTDCWSSSDVKGGIGSCDLGGLAGALWITTVQKCYSTGSVESGGGAGSWNIGGLAGVQDGGSVSNSYSLSSVAGGSLSSGVGGLIGYMGNSASTVTNSFSTGLVTGYNNVGGLVGYKTSTSAINTCFWDKESSQITISAGGKGKLTAEMQNEATFTSAGWDFEGIGPEGIWTMSGYPCFGWQPSLATVGDLSARLNVGQQIEIAFEVTSSTSEEIICAITSNASCSWLTVTTPSCGVNTPTALPTVRVLIDTTGLDLGSYSCELTISGDNGDVIHRIVELDVFDRVDLAELSILAAYWQQTGCDWGDDCKAADWYVDGVIDSHDLLQFIAGWLGEEIPVYYPTVEDSFETGDFTQLNWSFASTTPWICDSSAAYGSEGIYSARSGSITDGQITTLEFTVDTTGWNVDAVSFAFKMSSEEGYDFLRFYIDGVQQDNWSGEWMNWIVQTYPVTPGLHTFTWSYSKDSDGSSGLDCAWIDEVRIFAR